jgi:hypothetical protein
LNPQRLQLAFTFNTKKKDSVSPPRRAKERARFPGVFAVITKDLNGSVFSSAHTRTEGRAPLRGSEFTTKVAPKGGFSRNRCWAKKKFRAFDVVVVVVVVVV